MSPRRSPEADALTEVLLEVFRLNGRLLSAGDRLTADMEQSSARWQILGAIRRPQTVADIARAMGLARQSVQRTTNILEEAGLIAIAENPAHKRSKLVQLTPLGQTILDTISSRQVAWTNEIARRLGMSADEIRSSAVLLRRFGEEVERVDPVSPRSRSRSTGRS